MFRLTNTAQASSFSHPLLPTRQRARSVSFCARDTIMMGFCWDRDHYQPSCLLPLSAKPFPLASPSSHPEKVLTQHQTDFSKEAQLLLG